MTPSVRDRLLSLTGPLLLLALWQLAYALQLFNPTLLPGPVASFRRLWVLLATGSVLPDLGVSLGRMAVGYALAAGVGTSLGMLMGLSATLYRSLEVLMDFFRSLPVTTLYPIFVLFFGIGHLSKIAMVFAASVFVIVLNSAYGVMQASKVRPRMAALFGASQSQVFRWVVFYDALPQTLIGLRVALSYSMIVEIVCEMFMGTQRGIGQRVFEAYNTYSIDELYALVLLVGVLGYGLNKAFVAMERRLVPWAVA